MRGETKELLYRHKMLAEGIHNVQFLERRSKLPRECLRERRFQLSCTRTCLMLARRATCWSGSIVAKPPAGQGEQRSIMSAIESLRTSDGHAWAVYLLHWIATVIQLAAVGAIIVGAIASITLFAMQGITTGWEAAYQRLRANLGRGILLGLELLVAADIIGTIAVTPSFENLGVLALIIGIRTLLSISLEVEIEGRWPWRRGQPTLDGRKIHACHREPSPNFRESQ